MTKTLSLVSLAVMSVTLGAQTPSSPQPPDPSMTQGTTQTATQPKSDTDTQTPEQSAKTAQVQAASVNAELTKGLDAKHARVGDTVEAKTTNEAKLADGTALPKGTKLMGNVVDATPKSKEEKNSRIVISMNRAVLKDGREVRIRSAVTSMTAPAPTSDASAPTSAPSAPVAGGSAAGSGSTAAAPGTPVVATSTGSDTQSTQGAMLKNAEDRVAVGNKPKVMLRAPTTPDSAGILEAEGENVALESGTKLTLNVIPAQA